MKLTFQEPTLESTTSVIAFANTILLSLIRNHNDCTNDNSDHYDPAAAIVIASLIDDIQTQAIHLINEFAKTKEKDFDLFRNALIDFLHADISVYATSYDYAWAYGGAEEGGWYYDSFSSPRPERFDTYTAAEKEYEKLYEEYHFKTDELTNDRRAVPNHMRESEVFLEIIPGYNTSKGQPHYC